MKKLSLYICLMPMLMVIAAFPVSATEKKSVPGWFERIEVSGVIEVEASHQRSDFSDPDAPGEDSNDVDLATVELALDAQIVDHVAGRMLFKYEDDDTFVDEGFITISGTDAFPGFLTAGRQYLPFGNYDSHFVSDPLTLELGETNEGAVVAGFRLADDTLVMSAGLFKGDIRETGRDDTIDSYVAAVSYQPFEPVTLGLSYTSNLLSSGAFSETAVSDTIADQVGGWSAFATVSFLERFKLIAEYTSAMDRFAAGEIYADDDPRNRKPAAWNLELGVSLLENLDAAVGYGGSDDGGDEFLPETRYGAVVSWGIFDNTCLALEYLRAAYEADIMETDTVTLQLAIEF
jgi:hypothetical protein